MTKCKSWCGKALEDDDVPKTFGIGTVFYDPCAGLAYCSQACLDRATAKPATTAPVRKLAKEWERWDNEGGVCTAKFDCHEPAAYAGPDCCPCEAHAAEMGVFQDEPTSRLVQSTGTTTYAFTPTSVQIGTSAPFKWNTATTWKLAKCPTCTHRHVGPCNGTSPNGHFSCPCGHERVEAKREVNVVGAYEASSWKDYERGKDMRRMDAASGDTATLLANLERERVPGRRPIRTVRWYEGNGDE